jgi:hypothetical protein
MEDKMVIKHSKPREGPWDWMTVATAAALIIATILLVVVLVPQMDSEDLSSNPVEHPATTDRS